MSDFSNGSTFKRYIQAGCPTTPDVVLSDLACDSNQTIRRRVAENPRASLNVLSSLLCDDSTEVRMALIDNPALPANLLDLLVRDPNPDVRYALAECPTIPERILLSLLRDDNPYVANRASRTYQSLHPSETQVFSLQPNYGQRPPGRLAT